MAGSELKRARRIAAGLPVQPLRRDDKIAAEKGGPPAGKKAVLALPFRSTVHMRTPLARFDRGYHGHPTAFTVEAADTICDLVADGITLGGAVVRFNALAVSLGRPEKRISRRRFNEWCQETDKEGKPKNLMAGDMPLRDYYRAARESWAESRVDRAVEIGDDTTRDPKCRKVAIDAHLAAAAMFAPKRFGKDPDQATGTRQVLNINIHPDVQAKVKKLQGDEVTVDV